MRKLINFLILYLSVDTFFLNDRSNLRSAKCTDSRELVKSLTGVRSNAVSGLEFLFFDVFAFSFSITAKYV